MAEEDTPILTVNSRLARYLLFKNSEHQKNIGKVAWETPQIIEDMMWVIPIKNLKIEEAIEVVCDNFNTGLRACR